MAAVATATPITERALAPDLARGFMLLLIALANSMWYLWAAEQGSVVPAAAEGGLADRVTQAVMITTVDGRAYPMFAFLFAYGIQQLYARQAASGVTWRQARRLIWVRQLWLVAFGAVHAALLWGGDILGAYGVVGLVMLPLFGKRSDKVLKVWIGILLGFGALMTVLSLVGAYVAPAADEAGGFTAGGGIDDPNYLTSIAGRLGLWLISTFIVGLLLLSVPTAFLVGTLAARHRLLDDPGRHLPLLKRIAVIGIAVGWIGGVATALDHLGVTALPNSWGYIVSHFYTGVWGGVGYAALFGLLAYWIVERVSQDRQPTAALVALGRRSLSGYLAQSVLMAPVLSAWGFGLGALLSSWSMAAFAIAVWAVTVLAAYALDRAGRRGPAEVLLRRLTYGPKKPALPPAQT